MPNTLIYKNITENKAAASYEILIITNAHDFPWLMEFQDTTEFYYMPHNSAVLRNED